MTYDDIFFDCDSTLSAIEGIDELMAGIGQHRDRAEGQSGDDLRDSHGRIQPEGDDETPGTMGVDVPVAVLLALLVSMIVPVHPHSLARCHPWGKAS